MFSPQNEKEQLTEGLMQAFKISQETQVPTIRVPHCWWAKANMRVLPAKDVQRVVKKVRGKPARLNKALKQATLDTVERMVLLRR